MIQRFLKPKKGFTLVEFIVILIIFSIMAATALVNFTGFRNNIGLNNLAQDIALTVRQAQVFGWSAITTAPLDASSDPVRQFQGVIFRYDSATQNYETSFTLYTQDSNNVGDPGNYQSGVSIDIDTIKIQGPYVISDIQYATTKQDFADGNGTSFGDDVSIAFSRPRPEPVFYSGVAPWSEPFVGIFVQPLDRPDAPSRIVTISQTGEIAVQ